MATKTVWTPKAVQRPTSDGFAVLSLKAEWDTKRDLLSFTVDGDTFIWHRRGASLFETRKECVEYVAKQGWPLN